MPRILNLPAALMFSSTLSFTTFNFPACSFASSSTVGVNIWHGRHQSAQKSTITGWVLLASTTSTSKLASFTAWMFSDMLSLVAPHYAPKKLRESFPALTFRCPSDPRDSCPLSCFIQCDISRRRSLPRKILGHAVLLQRLPRLWITLQFQGGTQRVQQRPPVIRLELKSSPMMRFRVIVLHRIVQTACGPHHRHRTIAQAVYLVQAARLVSRRHQEDVRSRLNLVRQRVVVADLHAHAPWIFLGHVLEHLFVFRLARAQHHERQILLHQIARDARD